MGKILRINSKQEICGYIILQKDKQYPKREKQIKRVNQQKNDYQKLKICTGIPFIKWLLNTLEHNVEKTGVCQHHQNFYAKIFFHPLDTRPASEAKHEKKGGSNERNVPVRTILKLFQLSQNEFTSKAQTLASYGILAQNTLQPDIY